MSYISNKDLSTVGGGIASGILIYSYGSSNQLILIAMAVGAVVARFTFNVIPESGFELFYLKIEELKYVGDINNNSLFAYKCQPLISDKKGLCSFLRKLDMEEYEYVKNENLKTIEAQGLKGPIATGVATGEATFGLLTLFSRVLMGNWVDMGIEGFSILATYALVLASAVGFGHYLVNHDKLANEMEPNRASRLSDKIYKLSDRISTLESQGGYPKEVLQLNVAKDYFSRSLQKHSNKITINH